MIAGEETGAGEDPTEKPQKEKMVNKWNKSQDLQDLQDMQISEEAPEGLGCQPSM
jgi:hypothetical protein